LRSAAVGDDLDIGGCVAEKRENLLIVRSNENRMMR